MGLGQPSQVPTAAAKGQGVRMAALPFRLAKVQGRRGAREWRVGRLGCCWAQNPAV